MNTSERNDTDIYQAPGSDVVGAPGEFDNSSMFSPGGRAGRLRYFYYGMGVGILSSIITVILSYLGASLSGGSETVMGYTGIAAFIINIIVMMFLIVFMIKRLHDLNWTGWLSLLYVIPLVNLIFAIILLFAPGNAGPNKYGPPPRPENNAAAIIIICFISIAVIGILAAIAVPAYNDYINRAQQVRSNQ